MNPPVRALDRTDRAILRVLMENARISNKELAARVGIAPSTCTERLRRLEGGGIIRGYHAEVEPKALGLGLAAVIAVRLRRHSADEVETFTAHALGLSETVEVFHVTGSTDFLVHVLVRDADHLRDLAVRSFTGWPEVAHIETSIVFQHTRRPLPADPTI
jgi:DNA-binding Lrp family transcriptional regulator